MSPNLAEFLKVFTVVFTFSSMILIGRRMMVADVEEEEECDNVVDFPDYVDNVDYVDYDGMGNYGRFPSKKRKR